MFPYKEKLYHRENRLYNKIIHLSRNKLFYTELSLSDTFQNRINLIFLHISFLFILIKLKKNPHLYKEFYQKMFDFIFVKIELNMREIGYGDTVINKNMKFLVKIFYNILLNCENFDKKSQNSKMVFFLKYLSLNITKKKANNLALIDYFDKYYAFCVDLTLDSVLKGNLNFKYK